MVASLCQTETGPFFFLLLFVSLSVSASAAVHLSFCIAFFHCVSLSLPGIEVNHSSCGVDSAVAVCRQVEQLLQRRPAGPGISL